MIHKPFKIPLHVQQLQAVSVRLRPGPIYEEIQEKLKKYMAGCNGERSIDYPISFLPNHEYHILHDLRLFDGQHYFQVDCLILHPAFITLLEVKNIAGTITIDNLLNQLAREIDQNQDVFDDPISQAENLKNQLIVWLSRRCGLSIPVIEFVVFTSSNAFLQITNPDDPSVQKIVRPANLIKRIVQSRSRFPAGITNKELRSLSKKLIKNHHPRKADLFRSGLMTPDDIIHGVMCPYCGRIPMQRQKKTWFCTNCGKKSMTAHIAALHDYYLIFGSEITNKGCRKFLRLDSGSSANYILKSMKLKFSGENRARVYYLDFEE
ncbi:nuclease-related domain-containing protein [Sporolactobacillus putidus]|nr:nuclease-related domain-containing protein [Sporolactobacillus putidus]